MSREHRRIEASAPRVLLYQPRDRTIRHRLVGQPALRVDLIEQRPLTAATDRQPALEPFNRSKCLAGGDRDHLPLPFLVRLGVAQRQFQAFVHHFNIALFERDQFRAA